MEEQKRLPWQKGGPSPNPAGRPKMHPEDMEAFRRLAPKAMQRLAEALDAEKTVALGKGPDGFPVVETVPDMEMRMRAVNMVQDRVYGRPAQSVALEGADGGPLRVEVGDARTELAQLLLQRLGGAPAAQPALAAAPLVLEGQIVEAAPPVAPCPICGLEGGEHRPLYPCDINAPKP